jgi:hypothetical protein
MTTAQNQTDHREMPTVQFGSTADRGTWFVLFDNMPEANSVLNQRAHLESFQLDVAFAIAYRINVSVVLYAFVSSS